MAKHTAARPRRTRAGISIDDSESIPTIAADILNELRDLKEPLSFLKQHEGPNAYLDSLGRLDVLRGLSETQQIQLSALVGQLYAEGTSVKWLKPQRQQLREWARRGKQRIRTLTRRMIEARAAIDAVRAYVERVGVSTSKAGDDILQQALLVLDPARLADPQPFVFLFGEHQATNRAVQTLYDFFRTCRLPKNEAEVRVGTIGNFYWGWNVKIIPRYERHGDMQKGCDAVRLALARRKPTTDISRQSR